MTDNPFKLGDADYTPMFGWFAAALVFLAMAVPALFILFPYVGPFGMLACFGLAFGCIFKGFFVGNEITYR